MSVRSLTTNLASLNAQRRLVESTNALQKTFERLSSGLRVNRAVDDAAGLSIASSLQVDSRIFTQSVRNINDGVSLLDVAEGALAELKNVLIRIRELAIQSANGTLGTTQRRALDRESDQLTQEYNRILESVSFNDIRPLNSEADSIEIQAGTSSSFMPLLLSLGSSLARDVGDGSFTAGASMAVTFPRSFVAGDINGDGLDDVVVARYGSAVITLSNGDGTFRYGQNVFLLPSGGTHSLDINDFNNDGKLDLVARAADTGNFTVALGNGNGTFSVGQTYASLFAGLAATDSTDLNNDGNADIIITNSASEIQVMLGNGNGSFRAATNTGMTGSVRASFEDLNQDGFQDIIIENRIALGNGDGTFRTAQTFNPLGAGGRAAVADFNGDGHYDLVSGSLFNTLRYFVGNGDGTFKSAVTINQPASNAFRSVSAADINDDGLPDLLTYSAFVDTFATVLISNGDGTFKAPNSYYATTGGGGEISAPAFGVFNSNGVVEFAVPTAGNTGMQFYSANTEKSTRLPFFNLANRSEALASLSKIDEIMNRASREQGAIGAFRSRLSSAENNVRVSRENYSAAASQILDVDVARESAELVRLNIRQQAAAAALSQANLLPDLVLRLLNN